MFRRALAIHILARGEENPDTATGYHHLASALLSQGRHAEAEALYRRAAAINAKAQGEGHPHTAANYHGVADSLMSQGRHAEAEALYRRAAAINAKAQGEGHPHTAANYHGVADSLMSQGRHAEAEALYRRAAAINAKAQGEGHPHTAANSDGLVRALRAQRKDAEAEEAALRRALATALRERGEDHPDTSSAYNNLAHSLLHRGKHAEAAAMFRRALAIHILARGEENPDTAAHCHYLAECLMSQGKGAEAEAMYRRALAIYTRVRGGDHPETAAASFHFASALLSLGKRDEGEAMCRRALAISIRARGEDSRYTAANYHNLGNALLSQERVAEAEAMFRRALAINTKALGEDDPATAANSQHLANCLMSQGKNAEAESMCRRALAIRIKALGEGHPALAMDYTHLADILLNQGKGAEAEAMYRRALAIRIGEQGEDHPDTAKFYLDLASSLMFQRRYAESEATCRRAIANKTKTCNRTDAILAFFYDGLAQTLLAQGRSEEELRTWRLAAECIERGRAMGLGSSLTNRYPNSTLGRIAASLARAGAGREAWIRWEQSLARGLADDVIGRAARPTTAEEREAEAELLVQTQATDERISALLGLNVLAQAQEGLLDDLKKRASDLRRELAELTAQLKSKYGPLVGKNATLEEVQHSLSEGTVLLGWLDTKDDHWACIVRRTGEPVWVHLSGSSTSGNWTEEEHLLTKQLRIELDPTSSTGRALSMAEALARVRLDPLKSHLDGVKRLVIVNSPGVAGVPIEALIAAQPDPVWSRIAVSYSPSASMFVYTAKRSFPRGRSTTLLAVADPAYAEMKSEAPMTAAPEMGLAIANVVPNGNADLKGIRAGDVLMTYSQATLNSLEDLKIVPPDAGVMSVPVRVWREGSTRDVLLQAGSLDVTFDGRHSREVVQSRRDAIREALSMRSAPLDRLPGTRREVEAIAMLFPMNGVTKLVGEQARESRVQSMAGSGELKGFRYLHFATHGVCDVRARSARRCSWPPSPSRTIRLTSMPTAGSPPSKSVSAWELDADLVVLSACESGLGLAAGSEGYLGFAQPLLARGTRSLLLSLWKVDDDATALLMTRFYQNLLGRRPGLAAALPKAEALAEAKAWLRNASGEEVTNNLDSLPRGSVVRREVVRREPDAKPYADPRYWAAFVLVGAPD